jgi:hypothetical protein
MPSTPWKPAFRTIGNRALSSCIVRLRDRRGRALPSPWVAGAKFFHFRHVYNLPVAVRFLGITCLSRKVFPSFSRASSEQGSLSRSFQRRASRRRAYAPRRACAQSGEREALPPSSIRRPKLFKRRGTMPRPTNRKRTLAACDLIIL